MPMNILQIYSLIIKIPLPEGASIGAVIRNGKLLVLDVDVKLSINDHLIIFLSNKDKVLR